MTGCEYGDRVDGCDRNSCEMYRLYNDNRLWSCCQTCSDYIDVTTTDRTTEETTKSTTERSTGGSDSPDQQTGGGSGIY